jgi:beta-ureidopropionase / N-carbamoyl-L-amino-acid hydrolase
LAEEGHDLTVTTCEFATDPEEAAFSKVAGRVNFSLDVRSQSKEVLGRMRRELAQAVARIQAHQNVEVELGPETSSAPGLMNPPTRPEIVHPLGT